MRHAKARDVNRASATIYGNLICGVGLRACIRRRDAARYQCCLISAASPISGIVQLGLAYLLFTSAMACGVRSIDASIIGYVEPVLNPVWVFLFIGERPSGWAMVGGAIIIASVTVHLHDRNARRKLPRRVTTPELTAHE